MGAEHCRIPVGFIQHFFTIAQVAQFSLILKNHLY